MEKKIKGDKYELQTYNYLTEKYTNYNVYLWKHVPQRYVLRLKLNYSSKKHIYDETEAEKEGKIIINKFIDTGCDIMMINKVDDNDIIIVQCKNYSDKNVSFKDLSGFTSLMTFADKPLKGLIVSNTKLCSKLSFKSQYIEHVQFIKLDYIDPDTNNETNTTEIYQPKKVKVRKSNKITNDMNLIYAITMMTTDCDNVIFLCPSNEQAYKICDFVNLLIQDYKINLIIDDETTINEFIDEKTKNIFIFSVEYTKIVAQILPHLKNTMLIIDNTISENSFYLTNTDKNLCEILNYDFDKKICVDEKSYVYNKTNENKYEKTELIIDVEQIEKWLSLSLFKLSKGEYEKKVITMNNHKITPMIMNKDIISKINACFWLEDLLKIDRLQITDINCEKIDELKETLLNNVDKIYPIYKGVDIKSKLIKAIQHKINIIENNNFLQKFMADCYNYTIDDIIKIKSKQKRINKKLSRIYEFEIT